MTENHRQSQKIQKLELDQNQPWSSYVEELTCSRVLLAEVYVLIPSSQACRTLAAILLVIGLVDPESSKFPE